MSFATRTEGLVSCIILAIYIDCCYVVGRLYIVQDVYVVKRASDIPYCPRGSTSARAEFGCLPS